MSGRVDRGSIDLAPTAFPQPLCCSEKMTMRDNRVSENCTGKSNIRAARREVNEEA
jgi:hypothetical protein